MKRKKSKIKKRFKVLPITILAAGLIGIGLFPFKALKKKFGKKSKKRLVTA